MFFVIFYAVCSYCRDRLCTQQQPALQRTASSSTLINTATTEAPTRLRYIIIICSHARFLLWSRPFRIVVQRHNLICCVGVWVYVLYNSLPRPLSAKVFYFLTRHQSHSTRRSDNKIIGCFIQGSPSSTIVLMIQCNKVFYDGIEDN